MQTSPATRAHAEPANSSPRLFQFRDVIATGPPPESVTVAGDASYDSGSPGAITLALGHVASSGHYGIRVEVISRSGWDLGVVAELRAAYEAAEAVRSALPDAAVTVLTDNAHVMRYVQRWRSPGSFRSEFRRGGAFGRLADLVREKKVTVRHIRGHSGYEQGGFHLNRGADTLARLGLRTALGRRPFEQVRRSAWQHVNPIFA